MRFFRVFFYNPTSKTSVWERPADLAGRPDVTEMLKSQSAAEKHKKKAGGGSADNSDSDSESDADDGGPASKKPKKAETQLVFADEEEKKGDGEVVILQETKKGAEAGKSAAMEAEVKAARERAVIPLETRMKQFRDLLTEKEISAFSTWEKELHKIVFDPR